MNEMMEIQSNEPLDEGSPQISSADADWTDEEREAMRQHGYDDMDMLRAWLS